VSPEQPERRQFDRRGFLKTAGGTIAGVLVSAHLGSMAEAEASVGVAPGVAVPDASATTSAGNPIITDIYTADPDAFVHDGRLYLDTDRDEAPLGATDFVMRDWHVYSTADTVHWTDHGVRMALTDFAWANRNAWAPQMVQRNGKFYWYVPVNKASTNSMSIGVAVGDTPLGPFKDALGRPLIDNTVANHSAFDIDPTVLVDDDGQAYIYWGSFSSPRAAKLKSSMIELDELDGPGGGGGATGPRVPGQLGNAVRLNGTADYVDLPPGIASSLSGDFTVSAWVNPVATTTWSRIFDFGTGTGTYMFLAVSAGSGPRFAITTSGSGGEQQLSRSGQLPTNTWTHVAVTLTGDRFDEAGGADALDSSGNGRDATIVSPPVNVITPQGLVGYWEAPFLFKRDGVYYLAYARGNPRTGGNPATIDYATASGPLGPWTYRGRILDTVTNTTTNHSAIVQFNGQWYIVYHNGMLPGGGEFRRSVCIDKLSFNDDGTIQPVVQTLSAEARTPVAWYKLDELDGATAVDASGNGWHATLENGPIRVAGVLGNAISLDGGNQYVRLPTGILWNMYDFTIAGWVKLNASGGAEHVFDFGSGTTVNMYLTPRSGSNTLRFAITTGGASREQRIEAAVALPAGIWTHVAVTKSALVGTLYVNAARVGQNTNLGLYPARLGNTPNNWIGRSQNPADPFLNGQVDDFHIYQRGLGVSELRSLVVFGQINSLKDYIAGQSLNDGIGNSLTVKLTRVLALLRGGRRSDALGVLNNDFVGQVNDLRGSQLTEAQAAQLLESAALISTNITDSGS